MHEINIAPQQRPGVGQQGLFGLGLKKMWSSSNCI